MARPPRHADFFRIWTPEMAYVLGLWWTDGCMRVKQNTGAYEIEIASNDREHLIHVGDLIGGKYHLRKVAEDGSTFKITFCSREMYRDIEHLGGSPRKSRTIGFPDVPATLLPHFVRGVVDGDGTLAWNGNRPVAQIYSGSPTLLNGLVVAVERATGIPAPTLTANRENWYVKWSTVRAKCVVAWLYTENGGVALPRKAEIAKKFLAWYPKKMPQRGTITEPMRERFAAYIGLRRDVHGATSDDIRAEINYFGDDDKLVQSQFSFE
ncbi:MAG TPA: hypothetical protein VNL77_02435 [Roseiflexaceae bacterium]|nr:hypothetical protein [Roseiflexaceae bacterium]